MSHTIQTLWRRAHRAIRDPRVVRHWWDVRRDYTAFASKCAFLAEASRFEEPEKRVLIVSLSDWIAQVKMEAMLAAALRLRGWTPYVLTRSRFHWAARYFAACGLSRLIDLDDALRRHGGLADSLQAVDGFLEPCPSTVSLLASRHRDVFVGRHALSSVVREVKGGRIDLGDGVIAAKVRAQLTASLQTIPAAEAILDVVRPGLLLFLEKGYTPYGEIFDVAVNRGLETIQWHHGHRTDALVLKRYRRDNRHLHSFSLDPSTWERVKAAPWVAEEERRIMGELMQRYETGSWFSRKFLQTGKRIKTAEEVHAQLGLDPRRKTAVIFSHVLWDATFFFGENLFEDYEAWLIETVQAACANPAVNWVVKLHPDYVWKLKMAGGGDVRDRLALDAAVGRLPDHVKLVLPETDISTYSFFGITDYCLTVRGTIGIEMACFGIPVLTAGTGRYAGFGFTLDSATPEEYLARLAHIQEIPPLSPEQTRLAQQHAHALFLRRPMVFRTFEMVQRPLAELGHPLDHNVVIRARTLEALQQAQDLRAFADWVEAGREGDYLTEEPARPQAEALLPAQAGAAEA